tara:strand:+ start:182 stop:667 length:486 start_codon:yes stop_codon:yes gene_type:complete
MNKDFAMFKPGQSGNPRGRPKGSPNKRSLATIAKLEALGVDPIAEMAKIATDPSVDIKTRASMFRELAAYAAPKRKAVAAGTSEPLNVTLALMQAAPVPNQHRPPGGHQGSVGAGLGVSDEQGSLNPPAAVLGAPGPAPASSSRLLGDSRCSPTHTRTSSP